MKLKRIIFYTSTIASALIILISCKTANSIEEKTPERMFDKAMEKFKNEDWQEASQLFEVINLQYGASEYADDAQYHLAEIYYEKGEFILAAYNYNSLRRTYPTSPFFKISLYKAGLCYNELSPPFDRDQDYTFKAIETFQDYQSLYPGDSLFDKAGNFIDVLRNKLAQREFETAKLYQKLYSPKASLIYLDAVINEYPDTQFYELAYLEKINVLTLIKRQTEALNAIKLYKDLFPKGKYLNEVIALEQTLQK